MSRPRPIHVLLALLVGLVLGLWIDHGADAASMVRAIPVFRPVHLPAAPSKEPVAPATSTPGTIQPAPSVSLSPRPAVEQPGGELVTPRPVVVDPPTSGVRGSASWYDDPRKAGLYAAAGPALRVGDWRGRTVTVCGAVCFRVVVSDWCLCPYGRVIDLSSSAFRRLAPLGIGVIDVTVTW